MFRGNYKNCEFSHLDSLFVMRESAVDDGESLSKHQSDLPILEEKALEDFMSESDSETVEVYQERTGKRHQKVVSYYVTLIRNVQTTEEKSFIFYPCYARANSIRANHLGQVALAFLNRMIVV